MPENNIELATVESNEMGSPAILGNMYASTSAESFDEKLKLLAAIADAESLVDHLGEIIEVQDIIIQPIELEDMATHEMVKTNRIVLITPDGDAYASVSNGIETAVKNLFAVFGKPSWYPAIPLSAVKKRGRKGFEFTTLEAVIGNKGKGKK